MCPLRVILIFLSATVAGFFLLRGLNAGGNEFLDDDCSSEPESPRAAAAAVPLRSKVPPPPGPWPLPNQPHQPPFAFPILSLLIIVIAPLSLFSFLT